MFKRVISAPVLVGIGDIITTLVLFFGQGGFTNMNPWFIVFLIIGIALILWGLIKDVPYPKRESVQDKLNKIIPILEIMDDLLVREVAKKSPTPISTEEILKLKEAVLMINTGILNLPKAPAPNSREMLRRQTQSRQTQMAKRFSGLSKVDRFEVMDSQSGILDVAGFGLKEFRNKGKYQKEMQKLTKCRNHVKNEEVNGLIKDHIIKSEAVNTMSLFKARASKLVGSAGDDTVSVMEFIHPQLIAHISHFERDMREELSEIRVKISKLLKE